MIMSVSWSKVPESTSKQAQTHWYTKELAGAFALFNLATRGKNSCSLAIAKYVLLLAKIVALVQPSVVKRISIEINKAPFRPQKVLTASIAAIWLPPL